MLLHKFLKNMATMQIYKDGLKIYTTLDMDAQNAAVAAMQKLA